MAKSPILQIPLLAPNQTQKEVTINDGFSILERSLNDSRAINLSADVEVNLDDYTRAFLFRTTGNDAPGRTLTVPASTRLFSVYNGGSSAFTVKAKDQTGGVSDIPPGSYVVLFNDGINVYKISDSAASGSVTSFSSLPDTPNSYEGAAGMALVVKATEDGLEYGTISVSFTQLTDTPSSYTNQAGKTVRVNSSANAMEFVDYINEFSKLSDTPADYVGQGNRMVVVKPSEDGLEFIDVPEAVIMETRHLDIPNFGFESGDLTGWLTPSTSGSEWTVDTQFGTIFPSQGNFLAYYNWGQGPEPTAIGCEINLLDFAYAEELDQEAEIQITLSMASASEDFGYYTVEFYTESGALLSTATSPHYPLLDIMTDRTWKTSLPVGTRSVTVYFNGLKNDESVVDPEELTLAIDNLRVDLKLTLEQINTFIKLFDTPLSYTGFGGYMLAVNQTETGLEFIPAPSTSVEGFTDLNDVPESYAGAGGYVLRVNSSADGLMFDNFSFTDLAQVPNTLNGNAHRVPKVNSGETALEFVDFKLSALVDVDVSGLQNGNTLVWNADTQKFAPGTGGGGQETTALTINNQTANYQIQLSDAANTLIRLNSASSVNVTVPTDANTAIDIGSVIQIRQAGDGQVFIVPMSGVTVNTPETLKLRKRGSSASLIKVAANEWDLTGDLETL